MQASANCPWAFLCDHRKYDMNLPFPFAFPFPSLLPWVRSIDGFPPGVRCLGLPCSSASCSLLSRLFLPPCFFLSDLVLSNLVLLLSSVLFSGVLFSGVLYAASGPDDAYEYKHGISFIEELKYPPDFAHFDYANPDAPRGGFLRYPALGSFDSFNNMLDKGMVASGFDFQGPFSLTYDSLLTHTVDETASYYGRLAEGVWISPDYRQMAFKLREGAYWHDGQPITVDDVLFTFRTFKEHGSAGIRTALLELEQVTRIGEREILFETDGAAASNPVLAFSIGSFPILPAHYWNKADNDITKTTVEPPLGSGPYRVKTTELGRFVLYEREDDYWGNDVPVMKGRYNFGQIKVDYFRDEAIMVEALKGNAIDIRHETVSKAWVNEYEFPARDAGLFNRELVDINRPWGMWWPVIWNLEHDKFQDIRVREALWLLNDFEWENRVLLFGFYLNADSFFFNSEMAQQGGLPTGRELELLSRFRGAIPERVFTQPWQNPKTSGYGQNRDNVRRALALFAEAGWEVIDGVMTNVKTGDVFRIDFIFVSPALLRSKLPYMNILNRVGIATTARSPEVSNWLHRMRNGKFDGGAVNYTPSNSPGLELRDRFSTRSADQPVANNWTKIRNPVVDTLIEEVLAARDADAFYAATRALDRVLLWNFYYVNDMAQPGYRLVWWDKFGRPDSGPLQRVPWIDVWWWDEARAARVKAGLANLQSGQSPQ